MGFFSKQFIDVIEWQEQPGQLAWRFPMEDGEIQNGAQLTVREGQVATFFNEGQVADMFPAGLHTLETGNLPMLTSLMNWDKGFRSPFKSEVVFFSQKEQPGLKWGTAQPVTVRDPEFGPIRIRAFGTYSVRIDKIAPFAAKLLGTMEGLNISGIEPQLRSAIATGLASGLGGGDVPFLDLAANQGLLSEKLRVAIETVFAQWGLAVPSLFIESLSLPEEVQKAMDAGSSMRVLGDLGRYAQFQAAESMEVAAAQSGGVAGVGAGAAAAMAIGQAMSGANAAAQAPAPAAPATPAEDPFAVIEKLHKLLTMGALSQTEFDAKKAELLARVT